MEDKIKPDSKLAKKVLPKALLQAIEKIFAQHLMGTALVGGTALSGYYAGHRRSDDIDLFCSNDVAFKAAVLAANHLEKIGGVFSNVTHSAQYFHAGCLFQKHRFTIDVVLDENLFKVGAFHPVAGGVVIPSLETLLRMKISTLVSRTSEKDLFDVKWLRENFADHSIEQWIQLGQSIDKGVTPQNLLACIAGSQLREEACDFGIGKSGAEVFKEISAFRRRLVAELKNYIEGLPTSELGKLVKRLK